MKCSFLASSLAAALLAALIAPAARAQAPFYLCQIVVPNPPATQFVAPAPSPTNCPLDPTRISSGQVGLILNFSAGALATVSVQVTGDATPSGSTAVWNNHDYLVNETTSVNGNIIFPVTAVRLYLSAYTSGTITLYVIEAAR